MLARNTPSPRPSAALHLRWALLSLVLGWSATTSEWVRVDNGIPLMRLSASLGLLCGVLALLPPGPRRVRAPRAGRGLRVALVVQLSCGLAPWLSEPQRCGSGLMRPMRPAISASRPAAAAR
jgi:hypothetical protein